MLGTIYFKTISYINFYISPNQEKLVLHAKTLAKLKKSRGVIAHSNHSKIL